MVGIGLGELALAITEYAHEAAHQDPPLGGQAVGGRHRGDQHVDEFVGCRHDAGNWPTIAIPVGLPSA